MRPVKGGFCVWLCSLFFFIVLGGEASSGQENGSLEPGVVVEKVQQHSEAEKAGLQDGDVLLRWSRADVHGALRSPFDLSATEVEQAPFGDVQLEGLRGAEKRVWPLGQDRWGIQVRPNFPVAMLNLYREGQDLGRTGKLSEAAEKWSVIVCLSANRWLRTWLSLQAAGLQAEAQHWNESDRAYEEALQNAAAERDAAVQVELAWGRAFIQRAEWEHAGEHFGKAKVVEQGIDNSSLTLAMIFDELGNLAEKRNDLARAEGHFRKALSIREHLAPDSIGVATSLNNLSGVVCLRDDLDKAEDFGQRAFAIAKKVAPDSSTMADALLNLGDVAMGRRRLVEAGNYFNSSLDIYMALEHDTLEIAKLFNLLGVIAGNGGDSAKEEDYYNRALRIQERLAPAGPDVARSLTNLGIVARQSGDLPKAEEYLARALAIREKCAPLSLDVANTLNSLGNVVADKGDLARAENYHAKSLAIREKVAPSSLAVAVSLNNLATIARARGNLAGAEELLHRSLVIKEKLAPGSLRVASSLENLGNIATERGDLAKAEEYQHQALVIRENASPGSLDVSSSLNNLGKVALLAGDLARAEEYYHRSLAISERLAPGSLAVAASVDDLGLIARERRDLVEAEKEYRQALNIREKFAPLSVEMAWNLNRLAELLATRGDMNAAEQGYRRALGIWEKLAPGSEKQAEALVGLASIRQRQGKLDAAAQLYAQALDALEKQTARLGGSDTVRAGFRAKHEKIYREYVDLLLRLGQPDLALEVVERSRARTLLETLAAVHMDIRKGVDAELIKKERLLLADIKAKSERRVQLLNVKQSDERVKAVEEEISALSSEYQDVEAQIRLNSPTYAALTQPQPLSAKEIQQQLLDSDTLLLEYSLGEERSYAFLLSPNSLEAFDLPKRAVVEAASRRVYELLTARNFMPKGEKPAERVARIARADAEFPRAAALLGRMVLGPVAGKLATKRLLIVSDGALHYVPFAALPIQAPSQAAAPLVTRHEIVNLPSASVLSVLRRDRQRRAPAAKTVAVLADPVFDSGDVRVKQALRAGSRLNSEAARSKPELQAEHAALQGDAAKKDGAGRAVAERSDSAAPASGTTQTSAIVQGVPASIEAEESLQTARLTRSSVDVGWKRTQRGEVYLPRLQSTRREAEAIVSLTPAGQSFEALDFKANKATATSEELENYRIVHFATHALLNSKHPELSGLVLSLVNERGRGQSGFLGLEDIYNLNLRAELVVLSACETALGKAVEGEGMVGLTRGFMYAGASRVMASLWNINDRATADQMRHFYRAMLGQGTRPAAALRTAQLTLRQTPRWNSPYFWAAFQIQGEWK